MSALVVVLCGTSLGVGVLIVLIGLFAPVAPTGHEEASDPAAAAGGVNGGGADERPAWWRSFDRGRWRVLGAVAAGAVMAVVTGWPVGGLLTVVATLLAPTLIGARQRREAVVVRTEAIATWAEQLRDTIAAAAGLQEAIATTARVAPGPIRPAVAELAAGMRRNALGPELHRFAHRLDDPLADQIAVALLLAAERRGDDLSRLLDDLAETARADATMRIRTETARASTYNDARVVTAVVLGMFGFMLVANRSYLAAFDAWAGQLVLAVVGTLWIVALFGLVSLSQVRRLPRLLAVDPGRAGAGPGAAGGGG